MHADVYPISGKGSVSPAAVDRPQSVTPTPAMNRPGWVPRLVADGLKSWSKNEVLLPLPGKSANYNACPQKAS